MRTSVAILTVALFTSTALFLAGCIDMFDPSGGRYAQGRFVDAAAFTLIDTRSSASEITYVFSAQKPAGQIKLRTIYLFSYLPPETKNGPHLKFHMDPAGQLVVSIRNEDIAKFTGLIIFGDYGAPKEAISGAKSVNILQKVAFTK